MKEYIRSAPGKQGSVDAKCAPEQESLVTACFSRMPFGKRKPRLQTYPPIPRIALAPIVALGGNSQQLQENAANVLVSLLRVNGSGL
jgi:hypothetical protein